MNNFIDFKIFLPVVCVCAVASFGISHFTSLSFAPVLGIMIFAILVNGLIATLEDHEPSGVNNGKTPRESDHED